MKKVEINNNCSSENKTENDEENNETDSAPKVQFIDGKLIVDEASLIKTVQAEKEPEFYIRPSNHVLNQNSFRTRRTQRVVWSIEQTKLFYKALRIFGPNLTHMNLLLKHITRRQIRDKMRKEEKVNPHLVDFALKNRLIICMLLSFEFSLNFYLWQSFCFIAEEELENILNPPLESPVESGCSTASSSPTDSPVNSPESHALSIEDLLDVSEVARNQMDGNVC